MDSSARHPSELEFTHYLRGTLAHGHAAALFAHTLLCMACRERLESRLADPALAPAPTSFRRTDEPRR